MAEMGLPRLQNRHSGRVNMRKQFFKIVVIPSDTARGQCSCCSRPKRERGARTGINCDRIYAATPRPRTLNPAVTPPSRATSFLPLAPAIISTTTIYFHSFNAAKSEFLERDSRKIWMIRSPSPSLSLSYSPKEENERTKTFRFLETFPFFKKRGKDPDAWRVCSAVATQGTWREFETTVTVFLDINSRIGTTGSIPRIYLGNAPMHRGSRGRSRGRRGEKMENKVRDRNIWPGLGGVSRSRTDKVEVTIDVRVGDAVISDSFLGRYTAGAVESRYKTRGGRKKKGEERGGRKNRNRDGQVFYEASI